MTDHLLKIRGLNKRYGGVLAVDNVDLKVRTGEIHALIGPNGAGKTTLISLISGIIPPESGNIEFEGRSITKLNAPSRSLLGLARSFQVTSILKDFTCQENVALAVQAHYGHSFNFWHPVRKENSIQERAINVLESIGIAKHRRTLASQLAYGEQRQLELAIALAMEPKLLVLDEPLAGMGREDSANIVRLLKDLKSRYTILLVEHDMDAVFALADHISVMVYGRVIADGNPLAVREDKFVRTAYLGHDD